MERNRKIAIETGKLAISRSRRNTSANISLCTNKRIAQLRRIGIDATVVPSWRGVHHAEAEGATQ
jgi:hypothetical protein